MMKKFRNVPKIRNESRNRREIMQVLEKDSMCLIAVTSASAKAVVNAIKLC